MNELRSRAARLAIAASLSFFSATAFSQSADSERTSDAANETGRLEEIVVTAQKKAETANRVGMSITALSEDTLAKRGVVTTADLAKVVPGFSYSNALYGTPVYTLRGMGFNDTSSAAAPAVALYVDEVPLPFPILASIAPIDVERVEVLKGPQGTLFGQNSTGGAINYIAAKPTDMFQAGGTFTYGRFNDALTEAFVSGPISSTLKGRLAVSGETGGDWQRSYTRSDGLGEKRKLSVRPLLNWNPTEKLALM
ncbi:MAG TPA: TonB-dependent receptor plug domain-containing protein, partial [Paraburkholderia sp.]|uniref:TonB-dependent receptor plug domain-containing protein n=1 Tax=Paraburkholderia sp. TaxID=1926495 RepID=UPI002B4730E1